MKDRVTMRDVAKAAGVSPMTVSRALRNDVRVNAGTRDRVQRAAQDLGYVYDSTAQAFRTQKSGFVAVVLPSINNANFAETYRVLTDEFDAAGLQILLGSTRYQIDREEKLVRQLLARNPQALVLTGGHHTEQTRMMVQSRGLPVVEMWDLPKDPLGHVAGFSNQNAMALVVDHLVQAGRRKLAFVAASGDSDTRGLARCAGVVQRARDLGLPEVALIEVGPAPVSMRHGYDAIQALGPTTLAQYDALVCVSDPVAFGCLSAAQRMGLRIPQDLAITGFGLFEIAQTAHPRLTTVDTQAAQIGRHVARILDLTFDDPNRAKECVDVGVTLVLGETS